ncbi:MAG: molybdopterin molybdotransferase MoeA [Alphaproteobacteria bacterium]|nr:molybdopterin molybdotransferase MoeA [Alphaproteobacteria bacterium]
MISVEEAMARVTAAFAPLPGEEVSLENALGRVLAEDVHATVSHPPADVSAMDGYAVRAGDVAETPASLTVVGEAPAGGCYEGEVAPGEAVRIFTGGTVPRGADAVVMQENTERDGATVTVKKSSDPGTHIRPQGQDFKSGDMGLAAGRRLGPHDIALAAAMNMSHLSVRRKPRIAVLSTGDELTPPGKTPGPDHIPGSNGPALVAFIESRGGEAVDLGIAPDDEGTLASLAAGAKGSDAFVTSGGVSVGDHDIVHNALGPCGLEVDFWGVAMRPGKPVMFGRLSDTPFFGFPGNPVSTLVCAVVFLGAAMDAMLGTAGRGSGEIPVRLACELKSNGKRQDFMRVRLSHDAEGNLTATPFPKQDSAMLSVLAEADGLLIRPPLAPAAKAGDLASVIALRPHLMAS